MQFVSFNKVIQQCSHSKGLRLTRFTYATLLQQLLTSFQETFLIRFKGEVVRDYVIIGSAVKMC